MATMAAGKLPAGISPAMEGAAGQGLLQNQPGWVCVLQQGRILLQPDTLCSLGCSWWGPIPMGILVHPEQLGWKEGRDSLGENFCSCHSPVFIYSQGTA